jgi:hypothetical protein
MLITVRLPILLAVVILSSSINAEAQLVARFEPPLAGDCSVVIQIPESNAKIQVLSVKGYAVKLSGSSRIDEFEVRIPLLRPLREGDELEGMVRSSRNEYAIEKATVGLGVRGDIGCPATEEKKPADDRSVFELNPFIGLAIDNFAPKNINGYPDSSASTGTRRTFGVIGQYRLWGDPGDDRQLWLAGATLNGVRTADIDCTDPEQAVLCKGGQPDTSGNLDPKNVGKIGIQVLEHASTLEAHADIRFEFKTLQRNSSKPAKVFVFSRYGFVDVINPVTRCLATANSSCAAAAGQTTNGVVSISGASAGAFSAYYGGAGLLLPSGSFRDSEITYGLAHEDIYGTSRGGLKRRKLNAVAFVDLAPQFAYSSIGKALGLRAWRGFIALDVDRSARHWGADAIETYVGISFDLGKVFQ